MTCTRCMASERIRSMDGQHPPVRAMAEIRGGRGSGGIGEEVDQLSSRRRGRGPRDVAGLIGSCGPACQSLDLGALPCLDWNLVLPPDEDWFGSLTCGAGRNHLFFSLSFGKAYLIQLKGVPAMATSPPCFPSLSLLTYILLLATLSRAPSSRRVGSRLCSS
jgi:hypothetical protein